MFVSRHHFISVRCQVVQPRDKCKISSDCKGEFYKNIYYRGKIKLVYFTGGVKPYFIGINVNIFKIGKNNQVVYFENKIVFN
jgi:hypothetical protein